MIDEREEYLAYTGQRVYSAQNKRNTAYMGRFTFDMLLDFEGLSRVLTIMARGYMWRGAACRREKSQLGMPVNRILKTAQKNQKSINIKAKASRNFLQFFLHSD